MIRMQVVLDSAENEALHELARHELREPRDQVRKILRDALRSRGFLHEEETVPTPAACAEKAGE